MEKAVLRTERKKKPFQVWWDPETKREFYALAAAYDAGDAAPLVLKLIKQAIKDWYLPGYIKLEKPTSKPQQTIINNKMAENVIKPKQNS